VPHCSATLVSETRCHFVRINRLISICMNETNRYAVGLAAFVVLIVASTTLMVAAGGLFPQTEYRDWLTWSETFDGADALLRMITRQEWFSRDFSMAIVHISSQFCGLSIPCLNAWTLAPLALAAPIVFFWHTAWGHPFESRSHRRLFGFFLGPHRMRSLGRPLCMTAGRSCSSLRLCVWRFGFIRSA